jgi:hypothetical protein
MKYKKIQEISKLIQAINRRSEILSFKFINKAKIDAIIQANIEFEDKNDAQIQGFFAFQINKKFIVLNGI